MMPLSHQINSQTLKCIIEAVLTMAKQPLSTEQIMDLFTETERPSLDALKLALSALKEDCQRRGIELVQVASGYRIQVKSELNQWVVRLWGERPGKYSKALLETLSLIAYRQPVTRGEIEQVRGVAVSSSIIKTLIERQWIKVVGHKDVPGRPALYCSTRAFLDYFNLKSLDELPDLTEIKQHPTTLKEHPTTLKEHPTTDVPSLV